MLDPFDNKKVAGFAEGALQQKCDKDAACLGHGAGVLLRGFVVAGRAARFAIQQAVVAKANIDHRLAQTAELLALTRTFGLFALCAFIFGGTGSSAHENTVACSGCTSKMTLVIMSRPKDRIGH
jgi:hypothetical protein